jgi:hypothetical protein
MRRFKVSVLCAVAVISLLLVTGTLISLLVPPNEKHADREPLAPATVGSPPNVSWQVYSSQFGYTIQYPSDWSYGSCIGGTQISFVDWAGASSTCQGIDGFGPFTITGPLSAGDIQSELGTPTIHLVKAFTLNGLEAKQYSFLIYPAQSVITDLVTTKSGETFDLSYPSYDATNTPMIDHMLASFRSQNQPR